MEEEVDKPIAVRTTPAIAPCIDAGQEADGKVVNNGEVIEEKSVVIVYENLNSIRAVVVRAGSKTQSRYGVFQHDDWIGQTYGTKVFDRKKKVCKRVWPENHTLNLNQMRFDTLYGEEVQRFFHSDIDLLTHIGLMHYDRTCHTRGVITSSAEHYGFLYLLKATPELWTLAVKHRTQILYMPDISTILMRLELSPGKIVLESGTGSGSLTHALAGAVAPDGEVHTFEYHSQRATQAAEEFKQNRLHTIVKVYERNTEEDGFVSELEGRADGIVLDLPSPWRALASASKCLKPNAVLVSFSPCIEQVQRVCSQLGPNGFTDILTVEAMFRSVEVKEEPWYSTESLWENLMVTLPSQATRKSKRQRAGSESASDESWSKERPLDEKPQRPNTCTRWVSRTPVSHQGHTGYLTFARRAL